MWVWYGLVQVNTAMQSVAKPLNWITSRWALKNERYHLPWVYVTTQVCCLQIICSVKSDVFFILCTLDTGHGKKEVHHISKARFMF